MTEGPAGQRTAAVRSWREALLVYTRPRVFAMIWLGCSAGLPFLLIGPTLSGWQRDVGVERSLIGFFSWIGIVYSVKVLWAPVVDRLALPLFTRLLGKRRGWMLAAQITIAVGLVGMALADPVADLVLVAALALLVALGSATQDITIDAYRIEAMDPEFQGAMAAAYVFGYRVALLVAGAGAFYIAEGASWASAYLVMAVLMGAGMLTTLLLGEPEHRADASAAAIEARVEQALGARERRGAAGRLLAFLSDAVVAPFVDFFTRNGREALLILLLISVYKLSDITMGVMANPFYLDLGFSKTDIADVTKVFGFLMTITGAALGGVLVARFGIARPLLLGAVLVAVTNLLFAALAVLEPDLALLAVVVSADNLSGGIAAAVFIAYLSSLTNTAYTATQYALFSSLMTLPAKVLGGFSGVVVDAHGYMAFFLYAGLLGIPAIVLSLRLTRPRP
ncbi:MAG: Protein AmpG [Pseudomonadales bacterium]|nr:Protein AmpG [Pseudomonadales bacterium]